MHGDYYEYSFMDKYFFVIKCTHLDNDVKEEESKFMSHRLQTQAVAFAESTVA